MFKEIGRALYEWNMRSKGIHSYQEWPHLPNSTKKIWFNFESEISTACVNAAMKGKKK